MEGISERSGANSSASAVNGAQAHNGNGYKNGSIHSELYEFEADLQKWWLISGIEGGTKLSGKENLIAIHRMYKTAKMPPEWIIMEDTLPAVPTFVTKGYKSQWAMLETSINYLDDAVVAVKPSLSRISQDIKDRDNVTKLGYVLGKNDYKNIDTEYNRAVNMYNNSPEMIYHMKKRYEEKSFSNRDIIDKSVLRKERVSALLENLEKKEEKDQTEKKRIYSYYSTIRNLDDKIKQNGEEAEDCSRIAKLYGKLQVLWLLDNRSGAEDYETVYEMLEAGTLDEEDFDAYTRGLGNARRNLMFGKIKVEYDATNEELSKVNEGKDPERAAQLESELKRLANLSKKLTYEGIAREEEDIDRITENKLKAGYIFTGLVPGGRDLFELADRISKEVIYTHIRNAYGRRTPLEIFDKVGDIVSKGIKVKVVGNQSNMSNIYRKGYGIAAEKTLTNLFGDDKDLKIIIGMRDTIMSYGIIPKHDRGNILYVVTVSPLASKKGLEEVWKEQVKDPLVKALESRPNQTGAFLEVMFNNNSFFFNPQMDIVRLSIIEEKEAQRQLLIKKLSSTFKPVKVNLADIDYKDIIAITNKLPSEFNNELLNKLLVFHGIDPFDNKTMEELISAMQENKATIPAADSKIADIMGWYRKTFPYELEKRPVKEMDIIGASDVHLIRNDRGILFLSEEILDAFVRYELDLIKHMNKVWMYTMNEGVEGNYINIMFQKNEYLSYKDRDKYERMLEEDGIVPGNELYDRLMDKYDARRSRMMPNPDIGEQIHKLKTIIKPLLVEEKVREYLLVSGEHGNKTPNKSAPQSIDESTLIGDVIDEIVKNEDAVEILPGGWFGGGGKRVINGLDMQAFHRYPFENLGKLNPEVSFTVCGHTHIEGVLVANDQVVYNLGGMKGADELPTQLGMRISEDTRSGGNVSIKYYPREGDERSRIVSFVSHFVRPSELRDKGYLRTDPHMEKFERYRSVINYDTEIHNSAVSNGNGKNRIDKDKH